MKRNDKIRYGKSKYGTGGKWKEWVGKVNGNKTTWDGMLLKE